MWAKRRVGVIRKFRLFSKKKFIRQEFQNLHRGQVRPYLQIVIRQLLLDSLLQFQRHHRQPLF